MNIQWTAPLSYALLLGLPILWAGVLAFLRRRKPARHADVLLAWALLLTLASVLALAAGLALLNRNTTIGLDLLTGIAGDLAAAASPWASGPVIVSVIVAIVTIWLVARLAVLPWRTTERAAPGSDDESDDTQRAPSRRPRRVRQALIIALTGLAIAWLIPPIGAMNTGSPASVIATCWIPDRMLVAMASEHDLEALRNPLPNDYVDINDYSSATRDNLAALAPVAAELERRRNSLNIPARKRLLWKMLASESLAYPEDPMFWAWLQANIPATDPDRLLIIPHARVFDAVLPAPRWGRFDLWVDISDIGNARWSLPYGGPLGNGMRSWMHKPASFDLRNRTGDGNTVELQCVITWCDHTDSCVQLRSTTQIDRSRIPRDTPRPRPDRFIATMLADPDAWRVIPSTNPFSNEAVLRWRSPDAPQLEHWPGDPPLAPPVAAARAAGLTLALRIELLANDGNANAWQTESLLASSSHALRTDGSLHIYFTLPDQSTLREPIRLRITPDPELAAMDIGAQSYWTGEPIEVILPPTAVQPALSRR